MAIKTILLHLAPDHNWKNRLDAAIRITQEVQGHLIALYVAAPVHLPAGAEGRGASALFLHEATQEAKNKTEEIRSHVAARCSELKLSWEWAYGETDHLDHLMAHAYRADLTIINQVSFDRFEDRLLLQMPEKLTLHAGGPVLMIPNGYVMPKLADLRHVMIAWSYSREAIRAVRDSLDIIRHADQLDILQCGPTQPSGDVASDDKRSPIHGYLGHHGIEARIIHDPRTDHIGEAILQHADEEKAELIIMGAYGHTSILDRLFGSPTRYVVSHSSIPVLLSH